MKKVCILLLILFFSGCSKAKVIVINKPYTQVNKNLKVYFNKYKDKYCKIHLAKKPKKTPEKRPVTLKSSDKERRKKQLLEEYKLKRQALLERRIAFMNQRRQLRASPTYSILSENSSCWDINDAEIHRDSKVPAPGYSTTTVIKIKAFNINQTLLSIKSQYRYFIGNERDYSNEEMWKNDIIYFLNTGKTRFDKN